MAKKLPGSSSIGLSLPWLLYLAALCISATFSATVVALEDEPAQDDGEASSYEWAGVFETPEPMYLWTAQAVDGAYADPAMKMVVMPATGTTKGELAALEAKALQMMEGGCVEVEAGGTLVVTSSGACYNLQFNVSHIGIDGLQPGQSGEAAMTMSYDLDTTFFIETEGAEAVALFAEHIPTEFERSQHYLKVLGTGEDVEPQSEMYGPVSKPWGMAIGAAIIVNLVTLVGLVLLIPVLANLGKNFPGAFTVVANSFAAGALIAAAFFLLLYEATHLIPITEDRPEAAAAAAWGCMILLGFITAPLIDLICCVGLEFLPKTGGNKPTAEQTDEKASKPLDGAKAIDIPNGHSLHDISIEAALEEEHATVAKQRRIVCGILVGDFMHNFCDGIFIGSAFALCGSTMGWAVTTATVYHEIAQELSDFVILTDEKQGALRPWVAVTLNFISGTSVILGVVLILALDISSYATGIILAYGGGVYVHIGAAEAMTRVYMEAKTLMLRLTWLVSFVVGAAAIGLVLLDHEHCDAGGGHDHGH